MKSLFFLFFSLPFLLQGQFSINLNEKEVNFCFSDYGIISPSVKNVSYDSIGTNLKVSNGIPPYKYSWYINDVSSFFGGRVFSASYYLNDTINKVAKIKKDKLIDSQNDSVIIYLYVTDSLNRSAKDSLILKISQFKKDDQLSTLCSNKDTNKISAVIGGTFVGDVYSYKWTPKDYLIEDTLKEVRTLTKIPITYLCEVTNKYQCKASTFVKVIDFAYCSVSIQNTEKVELFKDFINPIKSNSKIHFKDSSKYYNFYCYSLLGNVLYHNKVNSYIDFEKMNVSKGIYYIVIDEYKPIKILVE